MDIKQLVLAAAGCLSYLARATPTPSSTAVANRSSDTKLQPTPEGRLSSFDVTARHIPPYMQKIIEETFLARERQQAKEATVKSSYEDVDLEVGGESLFRERRQAQPANSYLARNASDSIFRTRLMANFDATPFYITGLGVEPFYSSDPTIWNEFDQRYQNASLCRSPIAMRGYTTRYANYPAYTASYIGCTPDGKSLYCRSDTNRCAQLTRFQSISIETQYAFGDFNSTNIPFTPSNDPVLVIPLLEGGIELTSFGQIYNVSGTIVPLLGRVTVFSWASTNVYNANSDSYRKYITAAYLNELCVHVKDRCSSSAGFNVSRSVPVPRSTTQAVLPSSSSEPFMTSCLPATTVFLTPSPSSPVLQEESQTSSPVNIKTISAGAVGAAAGGMFVLAAAGVIKLLSNKLKKGEVEITLPRPHIEQEAEEIYSEVREHSNVPLENYPPLPGNGVPPSRALMNLSYARVRTISETSSNLTAGTLSTDSTDAPPSTIMEEYIEMGSVGKQSIYNVPAPVSPTYDYAKPLGEHVSPV